jgi:hypothetical protein
MRSRGEVQILSRRSGIPGIGRAGSDCGDSQARLAATARISRAVRRKALLLLSSDHLPPSRAASLQQRLSQ